MAAASSAWTIDGPLARNASGRHSIKLIA